MADNNKVNNMIPVTVRFAPEVMAAIDDIADRHSISKAEIVRLGFQGDLTKYLGNIEYVDTEQGAAIRKLFGGVFTELNRSRIELNRIGVNYNQEMRLKNVRAKYGGAVDTFIMQMKEEEEILNGINSVRIEEIRQVINHIDSVMKEAGEVFKCILG